MKPAQPQLIGLPRPSSRPAPQNPAVRRPGNFRKVILPERPSRLRITAAALAENLDTTAGAFAAEDHEAQNRLVGCMSRKDPARARDCILRHREYVPGPDCTRVCPECQAKVRPERRAEG